MRLLNFILIHLCIVFVLGIYLGFEDLVSNKFLITISLALFSILIILRRFWKNKWLFWTINLLLFFCLGNLATKLQLAKNDDNHLVHANLNEQQYSNIKASIEDRLRSSEKYDKYILTNLNIDGKSYSGKLLLYVRKDTVSNTLQIGSNLLLHSKIIPFKPSKNPQIFDYGKFMRNRDIYAVVYENHIIPYKNDNFNLTMWASQLRNSFVISLDDAGFSDHHLNLIQALLLGQKQAIDKETYNDFAEVGVVHILAVSGLHVGIILIIFQFLFSPLLRFEHGKIYQVLLSVLVLWMFAAIAGFSPSVLRATTMFSFLALGQLFKRRTNSINMLCLSALVLLLFNPFLVFEIGFKLSYAAVFAIVMIFPILSKLYQPKYKIIKLFWVTGNVSLAAQIGVLPFQLYYFHQFPGLFLVGNLVIIPFLGILLSGGIICIFLAASGLLIKPLVSMYSYMLDLLIGYVKWLSNFQNFVFQDIFFTPPMYFSVLFVVFSFMVMLRRFNAPRISIFLFCLLGFAVISLNEINQNESKKEFVIFHKSKSTLIGFKENNRFTAYSSDSLEVNNYITSNYKLLNNINSFKIDTLKHIYNLGLGKLMLIDSSGVYLKQDFDYILLSGSPDIHLGQLIENVKPKLIIADGNNYKSNIERWKNTAQSYNISFHSTYKHGAYFYNLNK